MTKYLEYYRRQNGRKGQNPRIWSMGEILSDMKDKKSFGFNRISPSILKEIKYEISYPLSALINESIESGHVPKSVKIAKVVPIYKVRDQDLMSNCRPISILPRISKFLERII